MALALYRKYRPATFAEVVGQDHVTEPLRTALAAGRINHAYLFSGPRGCGKTSSARIMARSLNCVNGPTPDPCGECQSCVGLAPEGPGTVDVIELDAASHGGVDDARELRDRAFYAPAESRYRVFIIDEAHMVTTQGFNALLKIVEEPPEHLIFIFATTEPDKVLTTIRSRTHHYPFRLIPPSAMRELLERNVAGEGVAVEPAVFPLVIRAGGGSARDTQSVLDQLLAGAGPEGVTYERAVSLLGVTDSALINDMVDGLSADDASAVFGTVDRLAEAGHDPRRFATDLLDRLRDLVLLRAVPDAGSRGLVAAPDEELNRMLAQAERIGPATLTRYAEIVHNGLLEMRGATSPRLLLELLCARMLLPAASESEAAVLHRLERVERRVTSGVAATPPQPTQQAAVKEAEAPPPERSFTRASDRAEARQAQPAEAARREPPVQQAPAAPEPPPSARPATEAPAPEPETPEPETPAPLSAEQSAPVSALDAAAVRRIWPDLLRRVSEKNKPTFVLLQNATLKTVDGQVLVLAMPTAPLANQLGQQSRTQHIIGAMADLFGGEWQVRCVHAGEPPPSNTPAPQRPQPQQQAQQRSFGRASKQSEQQPKPERQPTPEPKPKQAVRQEPDIPLPPEPVDEDMYAEEPTSLGPPPTSAPDPGVAAHKLLSDHLGARPLD